MRNKLKTFAVIGLLGTLLFSGCGQAKETMPTPSDFRVQGVRVISGIYQQEGINLQYGSDIYFNPWKDNGMEIICTDPVCEHGNSKCSAFAMTFSFMHKGKRILTSQSSSVDGNSEYMETTYFTQIYEADADGNNRKPVKELPYDIQSVNNDMFIYDNHLYYIGIRNHKITMENTGYNEELGSIEIVTVDDRTDNVICCMDLDTYEVNELEEIENQENIQYLTYGSETEKGGVFMFVAVRESEEVLMNRIYYIEPDKITLLKETEDYLMLNGVVDNKAILLEFDETGTIPSYYALDTNKKETPLEHGELVVNNLIVDGVAEENKSHYCFYNLEGELVDELICNRKISIIRGFQDKIIIALQKPNNNGRLKVYFIDIKDMHNLDEKLKLGYDGDYW